MDGNEFDRLKQWFSEYCRSFYSDDPADQKNIVLKEEHTENVCRNMDEISRSLRLSDGDTALAGTVALFHDVGRFPQYRRYRTFRDSISTNHAALGAKVLIENNVLGQSSGRDREVVVRSVALHNVFSLPERIDEEILLFTRMVRDADKLDIWRIFIDYYATPEEDRPGAAALGLPDSPGYSAGVLASLLRGEMVNLSLLTTLNDFRLLQLAWIFDLNFPRSFEILRERAYIDGLAAFLPGDPEIERAVTAVRHFVDEKLGNRS
jgi:hypothetical protein